jgi:hypothetical protein
MGGVNLIEVKVLYLTIGRSLKFFLSFEQLVINYGGNAAIRSRALKLFY